MTARRGMIAILVFAVLATTAYWVIWFFVDRDWLATVHTGSYYAFENAFVLADAWLVAASGLGAWALAARRPSALLWMLCAASAGLYLACMDVLYDLENGIFLRAGGADWSGRIVEALIIVLTFAGSLAVMRYAWRHRDALLHPSPPRHRPASTSP